MARRCCSRPVRQRDQWRLRWTDHAGHRRSESLPVERYSYDDALFRLREQEQQAAKIRRGLLPSVRAPEKTFDDLFDYWLERRAPHKRSGHDDASIIRTHLRPAFGKVLLASFCTAHVDAFIDDRRHLNVKTINNHLTLLITTLNVAKDQLHWITSVPKIKKLKSRDTRECYRYLRSDEEIARFLRAAREQGEHVFAMYACAVYTGLRAGELAALRKTDIDIERRLITVQRSFDGPPKSGEVRYVPILDVLLPILREWLLQCPGELVFPNSAGRMHTESARIFQEVLHDVLDAAGFSTTKVRGKTRRYIVFHDTVTPSRRRGSVGAVTYSGCRRSSATPLVSIGGPRRVSIALALDTAVDRGTEVSFDRWPEDATDEQREQDEPRDHFPRASFARAMISWRLSSASSRSRCGIACQAATPARTSSCAATDT